MRARSLFLLVATLGLTATLAACGGSSKSGKGTTSSSTSAGGAGGNFIALCHKTPSRSPHPQIDYTLQEGQLPSFSHDRPAALQRGRGAPGPHRRPHPP